MRLGAWLVALAATALVLAAVALVVASVFAARQPPPSPETDPQVMARRNGVPQALAAGVTTTLVFDTLVQQAAGSDISYSGGVWTVGMSGMYSFVANAAVNVATGAPAPVTLWAHKAGSSSFFGLTQALPAEPIASSTNSQYLALSTEIPLAAGDSVSLSALAPTAQTLLAGDASYAALARVSAL